MGKPDFIFIFIPLIAGCFYLFISGGLFYNALQIYKARKARQGWNSTYGMVTKAFVREHRSWDVKGNLSYTYEPVVEYQYRLAEAAFTGRRVSINGSDYGKRKAEEIVSSYRSGSHVTVYYNPDRPHETLLEWRSKESLTAVLIGTFFLLFGVAALIGSFDILVVGL